MSQPIRLDSLALPLWLIAAANIAVSVVVVISFAQAQSALAEIRETAAESQKVMERAVKAARESSGEPIPRTRQLPKR